MYEDKNLGQNVILDTKKGNEMITDNPLYAF